MVAIYYIFNCVCTDVMVFSPPTVHLLTNNRTLLDLTLCSCGLDDDAVCSLAKGAEHCTLKKLNLSSNVFTKIGATALYDAIKDHPTLTKGTIALTL